MTRSFRLLLPTVCLLFASAPAHAYFERVAPSARVSGLGGAFASVADDATATLLNPAGLAQNFRWSVLTSYQQPYSLATATETTVMAALPTNWGAFGVAWHGLDVGDGILREDLFSLGYARDLIRNSQDASLSAGVSIDAARVQAELPAGASTTSLDETKFTFGAGVLLRPFPIIGVAYRIRNITEPEFNLTGEHGGTSLDREQVWSWSYTLHNRMTFIFERVEDPFSDWRNRGGVELKLGPGVVVRSGVSARDVRFGIGITQPRWLADIGVDTHDTLGPTVSVSLGVRGPFQGGPGAAISQ